MDKFELIESYLMNALSAEDKQAFEQRLEREPDLKADLMSHAKMKLSLNALVAEDVREVIEKEKEMHQEGVQSKAPRSKMNKYRLRYLAIAVGLMFLIVACWWWASPMSFDSAFSKYDKYPLAEITRSETGSGIVDETLTNYLAAHKLKEQGKYEEALVQFQKLNLSTSSKYYENVEWFTAITLLKIDGTKAVEKLKVLALNSEHKYSVEINSLLEDLGE